jgi:putative restriction endonuclease
VANGLALCALHHVLLDLGVLGLTPERRVRVSALFVARSEAGQALDALAGRPLLVPRRPARAREDRDAKVRADLGVEPRTVFGVGLERRERPGRGCVGASRSRLVCSGACRRPAAVARESG